MGGRAGGGASGGMGKGSRGGAPQEPQKKKRSLSDFLAKFKERPKVSPEQAASAERQSRYDSERNKAMAGIYSGDYQAALKSSTTVEGAISFLEGKAKEYTAIADKWAAKSYKKTKQGVEIGAKHTEFGEFHSFTSINEGRKVKVINNNRKYAQEVKDMIEVLKKRVY